MSKKPWPSDAFIISGPTKDEVIIDPKFPTQEKACRGCQVAVIIREQSLRFADTHPLRRGRPVDVFCTRCTVEHEPPPVLIDLRGYEKLEIEQ